MPLSHAEEKDLAFAHEHPMIARGVAPVLATLGPALSTAAMLSSPDWRHKAIGMLPIAATAYAAGRRAEHEERAGVPQAVPLNPAASIGGAMIPLAIAGGAAALTPGDHVNKIKTFLSIAPFSVTGAAIGRSLALTLAYKKLKEKAEREGHQPIFPEAKTASTKKADGPLFDFITELPVPGGKFPVGQVEMDFQMDHPVVTTFKPYQIGGAAAGALVAKQVGANPIAGAATGYAAGSIPEAMLRYKHLTSLKKQIDEYANKR